MAGSNDSHNRFLCGIWDTRRLGLFFRCEYDWSKTKAINTLA